ncbi:MAG: DUF3592 domain-containing protein [Synergistaceae bacterium]|nr:DUF3592 domain-containing protein [Synergistaceae bacterium]
MDENKIPEGLNKAVEVVEKVQWVLGLIPKILMFSVGLFVVGFGIFTWWEDGAIKREYKARADGVVTSVEHSLTSQKEDSYTYTLKYSAEGVEHVVKTSSVTQNPQFSVGGNATILYNPSNPEQYYIEELRSSTEESNTASIILIAIGCVIMLTSPWARFGRRRRR